MPRTKVRGLFMANVKWQMEKVNGKCKMANGKSKEVLYKSDLTINDVI